MDIVRRRLILLLCAVAVLFIFGIAGWQLQEQRRLGLLYRQASLETCGTVDKLVELRGEKLANLAIEYSRWDEMVSFVKTKDPKWAKDNLVTGMGTYGADTIAVYDPSGIRVCAVDSAKNASLLVDGLGPEQIKRSFSTGPFCHFFLRTQRGPLEVRGATIVTSADSKHTGPTRGYLLVFQVWDSSYLDGMALLVGGNASLQPVSDGSQMMPGERERSVTVFRKSLHGPDGRSLQTLCITKQFYEGDLQRTASRRTIILLVLFGGAMIVVLALGLSRFVAGPLGLISDAMESQSPDTLSHLENDPGEFGRLAVLIRRFFLQRADLEREMRERARVENDITRSEEKHRHLIDNANESIVVVQDGLLKFVNPMTLSFLGGYSEQQLMDKPFIEFIHPDDRSKVAENYRRRIAGDTTLPRYAFRVVARGGITRWAELNATTIEWQGKPATLNFLTDITERRQAEDALRESEEQYRVIFEGSTHGILMTDIETKRFVYANPSICRMLGYTETELLQLGVADIHPEESLDQLVSDMEAMMQGEKAIDTALLPCLRKDGTVFYAEVTPVMTRRGGRKCSVGFFADITARKQAEEALISKTALLEAQTNASLDGILVIDEDLTRLLINRRMVELVNAPQHVLDNDDDTLLLAHVQSLTRYPEQFLEKITYLNDHPNEVSRDEIEFKSGMVLDRHSAPVIGKDGKYYGRIWTFRDITERKKAEEALSASSAKLDLALTSSHMGVWQWDVVEDRRVFDDQTCSLLGIDPATFGGTAEEFAAALHPDDRERVKESLSQTIERDVPYAPEYRAVWPDGRIHYICARGSVVHDEAGQPIRIIGVIWDDTGRKAAEAALADNERRYRSLWESANEGFCLHELVRDASGNAVDYRIAQVNPAYERILGVNADDVMGRLATVVYGTPAPPYLDIYEAVVATGIARNMEVYYAPLNRYFSISAFSTGVDMFATAFSDITDRKLAEARLEEALVQANRYAEQAEMARSETEKKAMELSHQSTHDSLTGLPNRQYFEHHLSECTRSRGRRKSRPLTVLFVDLDKFKLINDTLGHKVGDLLLIEVAKRMHSCLRTEDVLARMGGDEFTIILPGCEDRPTGESVASRIISTMGLPFEIEGHKFVIGASVGLASYPADGTDAVTLLKHADAAMYKAKQAGRGTFHWFTGDVDVENQQRANTEMDVRAALEKGQFSVYYQPIVSLRDGQIYAAEALLRWQHPEKGMISPSLFIPIAEEIGLIGSIGDYVLRTACAQTRAWQDEGIRLSQIAVNVSTMQVRDAGWLHSVSAALSDTALDPRCLNLELTETDFAADYESMKETLRRVRELGTCMAIDDFGMGQSSLSRLKDFPVIHLKIDGSFVRDIEHNKNDNALVRSIVEMAHGQGIKVTAEWVETEAQMGILASIGCDYAQGYFISPPLPADRFRKFSIERLGQHRQDDLAA